MEILIAATVLAVVALLAAERLDSRVGVWIAKPAASTGFVALALSTDAWATAYGRWITIGLVLSWLGDVLLIPRERQRIFQAGILSFLLGHVAYAVAFSNLGPQLLSVLLMGAAAALPATLVLNWLRPRVPKDLRAAVFAYIAVISTMLVLATGATVTTGSPFILLGAAMFYLSDLAVARDRFVAESFWNAAWGLPLYYGGQIVLALSPWALRES